MRKSQGKITDSQNQTKYPNQTGKRHKYNVSTIKQKITIILGGDFNAGDIDWESHTVCEHSLNSKLTKKFFL